MYAGGENHANGGGEDGRDALFRRQGHPSAAAASSSSSGRGEEDGGGEQEGAGEKQGRRKKQGKREAVARAIRGGLPAAAASCWGGPVSVVQETGGRRTARRWSRRERAGGGGAGAGAGDDGPGPGGTATASAAAAAWCCVCPGGDCSLEPNPSANGKEDPGVCSLLERNDFSSADCNPHADVLPAAASSW